MEGLVITFLVLLKCEVAAILGNRCGVQGQNYVMLHGFREVKCQWEVGEVGNWKGNHVAR